MRTLDTTPSRSRLRSAAGVITASLALVLAACGGSDDGAAPGGTADATTATTAAPPTTAAAPTTTATPTTTLPTGSGGGGEGESEAMESANEDLATGVWQATPESLTRMFTTFFEQTPNSSVSGAVQGRLMLHFDGVETVTLDYIDVIVPLSVDGVEIPVGVDGGGRMGYTVEPGLIVFDDRTTLDLTFQVFGEPLTFDQDDLPTGSVELSFELDGDSLLLVSLDSAAPLPTDWVRRPDE